MKVSALLNAVNDAIAGRLLVFFPGEHEGNSYRLLDARDGWNYLATPITAEQERSMTIRTGISSTGTPPTPRSRTTASRRSCRPETAQQWDVLEWELKSFVCEGEYARGLERILNSFLTNLSQSQQPAVWVSGFYGSGKSHLVRVLEYLWRDMELPGGETRPQPGDAAGRGGRPSHGAVDGRQAARRVVVGRRDAWLREERCCPPRLPVRAVRERRPARAVPAGPVHHLGAGERLPGWVDERGRGRGQVARQGGP